MWYWAALCIAAAVIGISKTGFPGAGILAIPLVAMVMPARVSTGLILPMLLVGDVLAVAYYRRHAVWRHLVRLLPCAAAGIIVGYRLLGIVDDRLLKPGIGGLILVMLALNHWRRRRADESADTDIPRGWWFPLIMGVLAGITTMMANAAGPIMMIYLLAMRLPKEAFIGTGAWYFLLLNAFKIPFSWNLGLITADSLWLNARLAPLIIIGGLLGAWAVKFVPQTAFNRTVEVLTALAALQLVLSAIC